MNNPEKLATYGTQDKDTQNKTTTQYVTDTTIHYPLSTIHYPQTNTKKNWALLQTTGCKDDTNIVILQIL